MSFLKKEKSVDDKIYSPFSGKLVNISEVSDPVFSKKMMGDGFAIEPESSEILSPITGKVLFVEGHAIGFARNDGLEILLHMGLDTVSLNGEPFSFNIKAGQKVKGGDPIGTVDWNNVDEAGLDKTTIITFTSSLKQKEELLIDYKEVKGGEEIGTAVVL
ncbi:MULTISPECIES: PTS glucose transporter subunit IIA [unclassified Lactococcus]|uniref:PTS sugar transporter subunit IIA n=1 Tax=unclassified Lactococcus TaxID=2643510 RepID=UPI0011C7F75D|nr:MULTISPECIES: PTS glucose transporter subunit IIA [unclassified Lactococcus]MQW24066.1 PTS glucose transporter subunit IIA [Lactococcus sp. dk101]TXK36474.1 PTS glucose transporter subunit IIA [Lactococcus sp. dk310]TXK47174.1 PTS glucose transporter subunit IIA [Lactococcus sp. dk322]